jgi:hypothetical protein
MLTETAAHAAERVKLQTQPVAFARFFHVKQAGDGTDFPFSVDFSTQAVLAPTKTKLAYMVKPSLLVQSIDHENGRSSIGTLPLRLVDVTGEVLKYLSAPALTLAAAMDATQLTATVTQDPSGMPAQGTLEITTGGVIERARYSSYNAATKVFTLTLRGADATTAATHAAGDAVTNGEQIRPGQRVQLFTGYAALNEADYTAWPKMEVTARALLHDRVTFQVEAFDVQRSIRRTVFLGATPDAPVSLTGNPITLALQILLSTGTGTNGPYDVLAAANGLGVPQALVDVAGLEALRTSEFPTDTYVFSITSPQQGKQFLEEQFWKTMNCYPVIKQDGKFSVRRYKATGTAVATLDDSTIVAWGWAMGDQQVINEVQIDYDWDLPATRGIFAKRQIYTHQPSVKKYGKRQPLMISSMGIRTANGGQAILDNRAFEVIKLFAEPPLVLTVDTFYRHHLLEAGDNVNIVHPLIPNPRTGLRGLLSAGYGIGSYGEGQYGGGGRFAVLNIEPRLDAGTVRFRLLWVGGISAQAAPDSGGATTQPIAVRDDEPPAVPTGLAVATTSQILADGTFIGIADATWTANPEADLSHYVLRWRVQGAAAFQETLASKQATPRQILRELSPSTTYEFQVAAVDQWLNASAFSASVLATTPANPGAPAVPTGLTLTSFPLAVALTWNANPETDIVRYDLQRADDAGFTVNVSVRSVDATALVDKVGDTTTRFYRVRAVRRTGIASGYSAAVSGAGAQVGTPQVLDGAITTLKVAAEAITNDRIAALAVDAAKLADGAVTTPKISAGAVTTPKIPDGAVTTLKVAAGNITNDRIAALAVDAAKLADGAVTTPKISAGAVTANEIAAGAVVAAKIAAGAVVAGKIAADAVSTSEIAAGAVVTDKIAAGAVTTAKISAGAVTANEIAAGAVVAAKIAAGAVVAGKIAANAITAAGGEIADATITDAKIANASITTAKIADLAVTNAKVADLTIDSLKLSDAAVTDAKVGLDVGIDLAGYVVYHEATFSGNGHSYREITESPSDYTIQSGDRLEYDIWFDGTTTAGQFRGGVDLKATDGSFFRSSGATDQNGLSADPSTDLEARAKDRWYHRVIPFVSGWVGKVVNTAASALDPTGASTLKMHLANLVITNSSGVIRHSFSRYGYSNFPVWNGLESLASGVVVRRRVTGGAIATEALVSLAVSRGGIASGSAGGASPITETIRVTFSNLATTTTAKDTVRLWWKVKLTGTNGSVFTVTWTWRIRRTGLSGPVIATYSMTIPPGKTETSSTLRDTEFYIDAPPSTGAQTYVLTQVQNANVTTASGQVNLWRMMALVRSV